MDDLISRQAAINALWDALYAYEDKMEKQFQESEDLDVGEWIVHREFAQNMSDIDRKTILELPPIQSEQPEIIRCKDCIYYRQEIDMCDEPCSTAHNVVHEDDYCSRAKKENG